MNILNMLLNDPIVIYSFIGLAVLFGIGGYYVYYFLTKINNNL
ncbi:MAG: DUF3149 domain-containing protein [Colwellia sp.]|nr:DUF3149 domain-containing protein [Colwellia sp.]